MWPPQRGCVREGQSAIIMKVRVSEAKEKEKKKQDGRFSET
jgi:hypothetical protein